jgi:predicted enzyme related to lactoylglutathione lyase
MPRVIHFEILVGDPERAMAFYAGLFGWTFQKYAAATDYWLINTGPSTEPGINGGLVRRKGPNPNAGDATPVVGFVCTVDVADVDRTVAAALTAGGTVALAKMAIPGLAWLAYLNDTESNVLGVYQADKNAK